MVGQGAARSLLGLAALIAAVGLPTTTHAQCASCGNPAFVSGGNDMSRQLATGESGYRLRSTLAYGYTTSDRYFEGSHDVGSLDNFRADLHIFSLATTFDAPFGSAAEVVLPYGYLASERNFAGAAVECGAAWKKIARALRSEVDESVFKAFSGTRSIPFDAGQHERIAVKVIDPRGNEVMVVRKLEA